MLHRHFLGFCVCSALLLGVAFAPAQQGEQRPDDPRIGGKTTEAPGKKAEPLPAGKNDQRPGHADDPRITGLKSEKPIDAKVEPKTYPKVDPAPPPATLSMQAIQTMLQQMGYQPQEVKVPTGSLVYRVDVKRGGTSIAVDIERSPDGSKVWVSFWFQQLDKEKQIPHAVLLKLLDANSIHGPVHFQYNAPTRQLVLALPIDNRGLTPAELQRQLEIFAGVYVQTEPLWNSAKW